ncbi:transcription factor SEF1 [Colletotrichum asianum]
MCYILRTDEDSARYEGRIRPILDICYGVQLEELLAGNLQGPCRKMGWVIDGCYREERQDPWTLRRCHGALSAREMANVLLQKRYVQFLGDNELDDPQAIDAERRLIYITGLDSWSILALIMTSPESQARLLAGFLQRHLCARPSIGVSIASDGPSIFALDFHLPFRVWRISDQLLVDPRVKASTGRPLRNSRNVNFLVTPSGNSSTPKVHGIYSGHVGFLVTGYDQWRWTAILATDTWFNTGECVTDKVERYQFDLEDGMLLDPLGGGQDDATKPIWEPRAYFLRIVLLRIGQVADEWELLRNNLEGGVDNMVDRQKQLFLRLRPFSTGSEPDEYGQEFEGFEAHLRNLKEILQELLQDLYETLKVGEGFLSTEVNYFLNDEGSPGDATECYPSLSEIRRNFNELAQLYAVFISLKERCDDMTQSCDEARRKYFFKGVSSPSQDLIVHDPVISETLSDILSHQKVLVQTRLDLQNLASEVKESRMETIRKAQENHQSIRGLQVETARFASEYYNHSRKFQSESICFAKKEQENIQELQIELKRVSEESRKNIQEVRVLAWHTLRFFQKKLIAKEWENSPRATTRFRTADQNGDVNFLLNTEEEWASNKSHIDAVLDIFCGQTLLELQSPVKSAPDGRKTALLIDGNNNNPSGPHLRPFTGGLTSHGLLRELRKKRYEEIPSDSECEPKGGAQDDAERRLVFVENLDSWGILALAGSAPESLSHALGNLIANHVCSKSSIRVSFSATSHKEILKVMQDTRKQIRPTSFHMNDVLQDFGGLQERASDAKDLLDDISLDLQETVRSGDSFMGTDVNYFLHNNRSSGDLIDCLPHLSQIRGVFNDLRHMQQRLGDWKQKYKEMLEDGFSARKTYLLQFYAKSHELVSERLLL